MDKKSPWNTSRSSYDYNLSALKDIKVSASDINSVSEQAAKTYKAKPSRKISGTADAESMSMVLA